MSNIRRVEFTKVIIEGFGSFCKPIEFDLDRGGINMIYGRNGHGKTTLFSALVWALYKRTLKTVDQADVVTWEEYRHPGFRGTRVVVEYFIGDDSYMIARHIDFKGTTLKIKGNSSLMLFKNGEPVGEAQHKGDQQEYINTMLGLDYKSFLSTILFGQRMQRLVEVDNKEKRDLFEKMFEVEFIEQAKARAQAEQVITSQFVSNNESVLFSYDRQKDDIRLRIREGEKLVEDFEELKKKKLEELEGRINMTKRELVVLEHEELVNFKGKEAPVINSDLLKETRQTLKDLQISYYELQDSINRAKSSVLQAESEMSKCKRNLDNMDEELNSVSDICPTCKGKLKKENVAAVKTSIKDKAKKEGEVLIAMQKLANIHHAELEGLQEAKERKSVMIQNIEEDLRLNEAVEEKAKNFDNSYAILKIKLQNVREKLSDLNYRLNELTHEEPPKVDLGALKSKLDQLNSETIALETELKEQKEKLRLTNWWITKGFSAGGLKAYVFNSMLSTLNLYTDKYAERLGIRIVFSVDLSKASKPFVTKCYMDGFERNYEALSGGQKQRVDVCLAFAAHDISSYKVWINLFIMDEVFEGLDEEGIETVFDLIRIKAEEGKSVYVISHSSNIGSTHNKSVFVYQDEFKHSYIE